MSGTHQELRSVNRIGQVHAALVLFRPRHFEIDLGCGAVGGNYSQQVGGCCRFGRHMPWLRFVRIPHPLLL
jgi:hypothetical protein